MTDQCDRGNTGQNVVIPDIAEHFPSPVLEELLTRFCHEVNCQPVVKDSLTFFSSTSQIDIILRETPQTACLFNYILLFFSKFLLLSK